MASSSNRITKVAIVGAGGYLGKHFTRALLATGVHTVTALTRVGSPHALPDGVHKAEVDYDDHASLVAALAGIEFLIITLSVRAPPTHTAKLARAAAEAGVQWVMPNAYGPSPLNTAMHDDMGFGPQTRAVLADMQVLGLKAVVLSCGFWYEFSLAGGTERYGFDIARRTFVRFDGGDVKIHTSTLPRCGEAVGALLSLPVTGADGATTLASFAFPGSLIVDSFHVSQNDMFASLKRVTKTTDADWTVREESAEARWANAAKVMAAGGGTELDGTTPLSPFAAYAMRMYSRVFFPGGDGVADGDVANARLDLPATDLDTWTAEAVRIVETGELASYGQ